MTFTRQLPGYCQYDAPTGAKARPAAKNERGIMAQSGKNGADFAERKAGPRTSPARKLGAKDSAQ